MQILTSTLMILLPLCVETDDKDLCEMNSTLKANVLFSSTKYFVFFETNKV